MVVMKPICFQLLPVIVSVMLWRPEQASAIDALTTLMPATLSY